MSENLDKTIKALNKAYPDNRISYLTDTVMNRDTVSTGSLGLDLALGGGLVKGRVIEIIGNASVGKTSLALHMMASAQKNGTVVYIDTEHSLNPSLCQSLGIDLSKLIICQPTTAEEAFEVMEALVETGEISMVVLDSVAGLSPRAEMEGDAGDSVSFDTPVYIRDTLNKFIDIVPICSLYRGRKELQPGSNKSIYKKFQTTEILTHKGWAKILGVVKKRNINNKKLIVTRTTDGYVKTTEDHCLFQNQKEVSTKELQVYDRIDIVDAPIAPKELEFIDPEVSWLMGFWVAEGSTPRTYLCNRFEVCNMDLELITKCKDIIEKRFITKCQIRTVVNNGKQDLFVLSCTSSEDLGFLMRQCLSEELIKKIPKSIINGTKQCKESFLDGFWEGDGSTGDKDNPSLQRNYFNNSLPVIAGIQFLLRSLNYVTSIRVHKMRPEQISVSQLKTVQKFKINEIRQFYDMAPPKYLFDIETEHGTFVSSIGNIVVHNSNMGLIARLMGQSLRKIIPLANKTKTNIVYINQIRYKIGVVFGPNETTSGGNALKFFASARLDMRQIEKLKEKGKEDSFIGIRSRIKVIKNKMSVPFKECEVDFIFNKGIDNFKEMVEIAVEKGLIVKSGAWFSYNGETVAQGKESLKDWLMVNPDITNQIRKSIFGDKDETHN